MNKLTTDTFAERLAQAKLATKNDIANFVKKTDFDDKLWNINKEFTSKKNMDIYKEGEKTINELPEKVKVLSTKENKFFR